ncbi:MAG: hypothetical protein ACKORB_09095, partial [Opitutia bacterium]
LPPAKTSKHVTDSSANSLPAAFVAVSGGLWQEGHASALGDRARSLDGAAGVLDLRWTRSLGLRGPVVAGEALIPRAALQEARRSPRLAAFSSCPPVTRAVSVVVPVAVAASEVESRVRQAATKAAGKEFALESVTCFDVFAGGKLPAGSRSFAFEMRWRHASRTLTDDEAAKALESVMSALEKGAGWTVQR